MSFSHAVRLAAFASFCAAVAAQEPDAAPIESGPRPGIALPACNVYAPSGPFAGKEFDAAAQIGKRPGVLLFVHELTRNTAPMITGLDKLAVQLAWTGLQTHTIRIAAERSEAEIAVKRSSDAIGLFRPILVTTDGAEGPGGYALNRKATLTLVLSKEGKVVRSVAFTDTGRADLGRLRELVEEVTGPIPTDEAEMRQRIAATLPTDPGELRDLVVELTMLVQYVERVNEQRMRRQQQNRRGMQQRQPEGEAGARGSEQGEAAKKREGAPPEDDELRSLLRRCIQRAADAAELDKVFVAINERVGSDAGLRKQAVEMFKLMISLDYGNDDARRRAKAWIGEHGK